MDGLCTSWTHKVASITLQANEYKYFNGDATAQAQVRSVYDNIANW